MGLEGKRKRNTGYTCTRETQGLFIVKHTHTHTLAGAPKSPLTNLNILILVRGVANVWHLPGIF